MSDLPNSESKTRKSRVIFVLLVVIAIVIGISTYYFSSQEDKITENQENNNSRQSEETVADTPLAIQPALSSKPADDSGQQRVFHIGIVTATEHQGIEIDWAMKKIFERYQSTDRGGIIKHVTYPDNFMMELEKTMAVIEDLANDPLIKVIYVMEGVPGTAEAFQNIRKKRPDILLLASESHEDPALISKAADLVVTADFIARGYLIPYTAKLLGAKTFVHVSFPRHMIDESLNRRRAIMELACQELGLSFVYENAPDPTAEEGLEAAQNFILENVPIWLEKYGPDTAFFTTNNAHTAPMIKQIIEYGGYFVEADEASPIFGYPEALGLEIDESLVEWQEIIDMIEQVLVNQGIVGRLGTWTSSLTYSHISAMVEFGRLVASGEVDKNDTKTLLECYEKTAPGVKWNGTYYFDQYNNEYQNIFLIFQDTYIFGKGYVETTKVKIPVKYHSASIENTKSGKVNYPFHIAIATGMMDQGAEDVIGAQEMVRRYGSAEDGGLIRHVFYPNEYLNSPDDMAELIENLASDPELKVIVVNQAIPGTAEGFSRVKKVRPDIFCLSGEPHEPPDVISRNADLVIAGDYVSRGYLIPFAAKELGADTLIHISFERHLTYETMRLRAKIMEEACKELGLKFFHETAPDPTTDIGVEGAQRYILETFPKWMEKYGDKTAFFTTNDSHTEPLIKAIAREGGFFIEADIPSPLLGYPNALDLDLSPFVGQWSLILKLVEEAVQKHGGDKRLGTWAYPLGFTQSAGLLEFGKLLAEGKTNVTDVPAILDSIGIFSPGARWSGSFLNDPVTGRLVRNYFLIYQDTYIFGRGYIETTKVEIPDKFYQIRLTD